MNSEEVINILVERLAGKGMEINAIPAFIRNLAYAIMDAPCSDFPELNGHLHSLGWESFELDDYMLQLVLAVFGQDVVKKSPHLFEEYPDLKAVQEKPHGKTET